MSADYQYAIERYIRQPRRKHRSSHVVLHCKPSVRSDSHLRDEAEQTRWWLLDNGHWQDTKRLMYITYEDSDDDKKHAYFPLSDHPDDPGVTQENAYYYLGTDGMIYIETEDDFIPFEPENTNESAHEVEYIITILRLVRGE